MDGFVLTVFALVYAGMVLGRLPGLALDRTGVALLGTLLLLVANKVSAHEAVKAVDMPTMALLFGLMVVSAQLRLGGFYARVTRQIASAQVSPAALLALVIGTSGVLSALLANDIVCLAMTPILVEGCVRRGLDPKPFLLALACAANVGSAATLIGNPQNMLIGQTLGLSFSAYLIDAGLPALAGLAVTWWIIVALTRGSWRRQVELRAAASAPEFDPWQSQKGVLVLSVLTLGFLFSSWPRELLALGAAAMLLTSRRMRSRTVLGLVDWQLLVLFIGLFIVNHALAASGMAARALHWLSSSGLEVSHPVWLFVLTPVLSNVVSNVPATMLLLPAATHPLAGPILALSSTLAGNLLVVGSIANIIVIDQAQRLGVSVSWREHARVGVPVTFATLLLAAGWLLLRTVS